MRKELYCFEHIPKTGGKSVLSSLERAFGPDKVYALTKGVVEPIPDEAIVVTGHRARASLPTTEGVKFFTFVREPVSLAISHYEHISRSIRTKHFWDIRIRRKTLDMYLDEGVFTDFDNGLIRRITEAKVAFGSIGQEHLHEAIRRLESEYVFVGLTERFDESIFGLSLILPYGDQLPYYTRRNESSYPVYFYTDETRDRLRELNKYDIQLYQYCRDRFDRFLVEKQEAYRQAFASFFAVQQQVPEEVPVWWRRWVKDTILRLTQ